jgi:hypothetical protein
MTPLSLGGEKTAFLRQGIPALPGGGWLFGLLPKLGLPAQTFREMCQMLLHDPFITIVAAVVSVVLIAYGIFDMVCAARAIYRSWKADEYSERLWAVTHPSDG